MNDFSIPCADLSQKMGRASCTSRRNQLAPSEVLVCGECASFKLPREEKKSDKKNGTCTLINRAPGPHVATPCTDDERCALSQHDSRPDQATHGGDSSEALPQALLRALPQETHELDESGNSQARDPARAQGVCRIPGNKTSASS